MRCFSRADCLVSPVEPTWTRLVASDQPVIRTALFFCAASSVSPVEPTLTNVFSSDQPVIYTVLPREFLSFNLLSSPPLWSHSRSFNFSSGISSTVLLCRQQATLAGPSGRTMVAGSLGQRGSWWHLVNKRQLFPAGDPEIRSQTRPFCSENAQNGL